MSTASTVKKSGKKASFRASTKTPPRTFIKKKTTVSSFSVPPETPPKTNTFRVFIQRFSVTTVIQKIKSGKKTQTLSIIILGLLFIGAAGAAVYSFQLYQQSEQKVKTLQNRKDLAKVESQKIIDAVGKLIVLPKDETPTIATVTDSKKLHNQPFFAKASNGDKVLIYSKAKKAILFNPNENKVVEVAPVNIGKTAKPEVAGAVTQAPLPVVSTIPTVTRKNPSVIPVETSTMPQN